MKCQLVGCGRVSGTQRPEGKAARVMVDGVPACLDCAYVRVRDVSYRGGPITIEYLPEDA